MSESLGGLRHRFTAGPKGQDGRSGFRTVAHSPELQPLLDPVESLVDGYQAAEADSPGCRQLLPIPEQRGAIYALTTFTPLGKMPDGRPGNYWAETVVVPSAWLERAGWDIAAAFASLDWPVPAETSSRPLEAEALPEITAGPLERLEAVVNLVPDSGLAPLIQLIAQQVSLGLKPLRLLEDPMADPSDLETLVPLLPLLLPPALRRVRDGNIQRCLTVRSRSPEGGMSPAADFTGFPAAAYAALEQERATVIDLGGRLSPPKLTNRAGEAYAAWLAQVLRNRRWDVLEEAYLETVESPQVWLANFRNRDLQPAAGPKAVATTPAKAQTPQQNPVPPSDPSRYRQQQAAWAAREEIEGEFWEEAERYRQELEEELAGLQAEMSEAVNRAGKSLGVALDQQRKLLEDQQDQALKDLEKAGMSRQRALEQAATPLVAQVEADPEGVAGDPGSWAKSMQDDVRRLRRQIGVLQGEKRQKTGDRGGTGLRILDIVVLALLLLVLGLQFRDLLSGADPAVTDPGEVEEARLERVGSLVTTLQRGAAAAALLRRTAAMPELDRRARPLALAAVLDQTPAPDGRLRCVLLQAALHRSAKEAGQTAIAVDGACGFGTNSALLEATAEGCCKEIADRPQGKVSPALRACLLGKELGMPEQQACSGVDPWGADRVWTRDQAARAETLFMVAETTLSGAKREQYATALKALHPADSGTLVAGLAERDFSPEDARQFLDFAHALLTGNPQDTFPAQPSDDQLTAVEGLLAELTGQEPVAGGAG